MSVPVWVTPAGFLGTVTERTYAVILLTAINADNLYLISGELPTGLSLSYTVPTGTISGTPASTGKTVTAQFVIRAKNSYGVTDQTFTIDTQGLSNLNWITPPGYLNVGFGNEKYVINYESVNFQMQASPGQTTSTISSSAFYESNTLYFSNLNNIDPGQPGIWRTIGGVGIQPGTTVTSVSSIYNPTFQGYAVGISLPLMSNLSTGSQIIFYDSLPPGNSIRYYLADGSGQLPPKLTLSSTGLLSGTVDDNLGVDLLISSNGGYDEESYDGYPYDHGILFNGQYVQIIEKYIPKIYQFTVTATDGTTFTNQNFKILVVDPSNLVTDTSYLDASGPSAAESSYLVRPVWLGD